MGDAAHEDSLGPDATRAMPGYRRFGPEQIRFASNAAAGESRTSGTGGTSGTDGGSGWAGAHEMPYGTRASQGSRSGPGHYGAQDWQGVRGQQEMPGPAARPDADGGPGGPGWLSDGAEANWPLPEPATGWFGRHPDLWVVGGGLIVATAAMVAAFAAANGAMTTGFSQPPRATTTQAPASSAPATGTGRAPTAGSVCVFATPPLVNRPVAKR